MLKFKNSGRVLPQNLQGGQKLCTIAISVYYAIIFFGLVNKN